MSDSAETELTEASRILDSYFQQAIGSRTDWLETRLQALANDGVELSRISIEEHPDGRSVITIDSIPLCEWKLVWPDENSLRDPT